MQISICRSWLHDACGIFPIEEEVSENMIEISKRISSARFQHPQREC